RRAHYHGVAADGDGGAEEIIAIDMVGDEFLLLRPDRAAANEDVGRALIPVRADVVVRRAHHHGVAADSDGGAEEITGRAVVGDAFLVLRPARAAANEDVGRALIPVRAAVGALGAHHHGVAANGHPVAKAIACRAVAGGEFLLLGPARPVAREDVGRALT